MPAKRHALRFYGIPSEVVVSLLYLFILFIGHLIKDLSCGSEIIQCQRGCDLQR